MLGATVSFNLASPNTRRSDAPPFPHPLETRLDATKPSSSSQRGLQPPECGYGQQRIAEARAAPIDGQHADPGRREEAGDDGGREEALAAEAEGRG